MSMPDRRAMIDPANDNLSVRRQCQLLQLTRSGVYRPKSPVTASDLVVMRRIDEVHLERPFYGSRRMTFELNETGHGINRKHVQRLMRVMDIVALVPRPGTSRPAPGHKIYPYLLRGVAITEPNHVWASDITYIPMARGFLYLNLPAHKAAGVRNAIEGAGREPALPPAIQPRFQQSRMHSPSSRQ